MLGFAQGRALRCPAEVRPVSCRLCEMHASFPWALVSSNVPSVFHSSCIARSFISSSNCPVCRVTVGEPQGKSPSGTMTVSIVPTPCAGHSCDTIMITYSIRPGVQMPYHDNPDRRHSGKSAAAYLPNCREGSDLLRRLKYAFLRGLTFTVGTSMTTGARDQCTWASVHHKTALQGGARMHGYPDPQYLANANGELDALGVPKASDLDDRGNEKASL